MSDESRILVLTVEAERLRQENDRLRAENAALRPRVSELEHANRLLKRHAETNQTANPAREHA